MSVWETVKRFFAGPLGSQQSEDEEEKSPLVEVLHPLDVMRHEALKEQSKAEEHQTAFQSPQERQSIEQNTNELRRDILALHERLDTGLDEDDLQKMADALRAHCDDFKKPHPDELDDLAMLAVMDDFHNRALKWGWADFEERLQKAGLEWPEPTGLSPNADPDEVERYREHHHKEMRDNFLHGSFRRFPDLLVGVVPAWRHLFPKQGGPVWTTAVYESVAGGLACRRLHHLEKVAEREEEQLERLVADALEDALKGVKEKLRAGVGSIAEARLLSQQAVSICQKVAPAVVWEYLKDKV